MKNNILIIEDELIVSEVYAHFLKKNGFDSIQQTDDIEVAKDLIKQHQFDLLILDINVNKRNSGVELASFLRSQNNQTPIIFSTGNSLKETTELTHNISNSSILIKPADLDTLLTTINKIIT